jgi:type IV secretory pathway TraG/TraD family ATPase VirD4
MSSSDAWQLARRLAKPIQRLGWRVRLLFLLPVLVLIVAGPVLAALLAVVELVVVRLRRRGRSGSVVTDTTHGSARFATNRDLRASGNLALDAGGDQFLYGVSEIPERQPKEATAFFPGERSQYFPLVVSGSKASDHANDGHVITIAGSGAGKGVSVIIPNLLNYQGSCVVLDPKAENFAATAIARERMGHRVCLVDPFGAAPADLAKQYRSALNPLDRLAAFAEAGEVDGVYDEAAVIADLLVVSTGQERDPHWNEKARAFIKAALMFVAFAPVYSDRSRHPVTLLTMKDAILNWLGSEYPFRF